MQCDRFHPAGTSGVMRRAWASAGPGWGRVLACACGRRPRDALQPGQALALLETFGTAMWGGERALFANFVYFLIRKTRLVLANSGSGHIWGKGVT